MTPVEDVRGDHTCRPTDTSPLTPTLVNNFCHRKSLCWGQVLRFGKETSRMARRQGSAITRTKFP